MSQTIASKSGSAGFLNPKNRLTLTWVLFLLPALFVYLTFMAGPLFDSLRLSLYTGEGYNPTEFVGFQNYINLFTNPLWREKFINAFTNTCVFFAIHMLVQNIHRFQRQKLFSHNHFCACHVVGPCRRLFVDVDIEPAVGGGEQDLHGDGLEAICPALAGT